MYVTRAATSEPKSSESSSSILGLVLYAHACGRPSYFMLRLGNVIVTAAGFISKYFVESNVSSKSLSGVRVGNTPGYCALISVMNVLVVTTGSYTGTPLGILVSIVEKYPRYVLSLFNVTSIV